MKKKSASQSAFFNLRVLFGLFMVLAGVLLALLGLGGFSVQAQSGNYPATKSADPLVPALFDCSRIRELGIDKQENFRAQAIMIYCGQAEGGSASPSSPGGPASKFMQKLLAPLVFGAADVDLITGTETSPNITQSETYTAINPDNLNQVLVAYNDSRGRNASPINISGASISTDGGTTFTRLTIGGQSPFPGTEGDPVALYNKPTGTWYTVWLDTLCGAQGLGGYKSATPENAASWTHFCVHSGGSDDRESGWADNNPGSPFYGRMYISWNDFNVGGGALFVSRSTDNGLTWSAGVQLANGTPFIRDVQITGDMSGNGTIYVAGMNEGGGGFPHNNNNLIFRSTDGGVTWLNTYTGPAFPGPGVTAVGYFACMFSDGGGYWRHEGWGEPAAFNNVVHLVYAQQGAAGDAGDVYYIRSTDSGLTFAAPFKLNTDATTRPQWQVNLSASPTGTLFATWYDGRESAGCTRGNPAVPCYRMYSRKSNDNGASWLPDMAFSDVVSPLPAQSDPGIQATYAGDYDYGSALAAKHVTSWTDGRVAIGGASQQDAFTDRELVGFAVTNTNPACGSIVFAQPTDFVVNITDPADPATVQASDFTVNALPANTVMYTAGSTTMTFHFNTSPVATQGVQTMHVAAGAFNKAADNMPVLDFTCTFRYDALLLQVTTTVPPVGGTFSPPAPNSYTYDVNFNEAVDPASVQTSDLTLSGSASATVTGVSVINANLTARFTLNATFGGSVTANIAAGAMTDQFGNPNAAFSGSYSVAGCPPQQYILTPGVDPIVPGTVDTGNHVDDGATTIALPFPFQLYGNTYNSVGVVSNGFLNFVSPNSTYITACLPTSGFDFTIFPLWHDWRTDVGLSGCSTWANGCGVFTSVSGVAPNRIFNIEWHVVRYSDNTQTGNFEVRLYENSVATNGRFDVIYGTSVGTPGNGDTAGVQGNSGAGFFTQEFCSIAAPQNVSRAYTFPTCVLAANSAVSRKMHTGVGNFDIPLPLSGTPGIECRQGGATNDYSMVVTFNVNVNVTGAPQAEVISGTGCVGSGGACNGGAVTVSSNIVTIPLTNVGNAQTINVRINGAVAASPGAPSTDVVIPMTRFLGDTNASGSVTSADISQTKSRIGQTVDGTNFRSDVNAGGSINSTDVTIIKMNLP